MTDKSKWCDGSTKPAIVKVDAKGYTHNHCSVCDAMVGVHRNGNASRHFDRQRVPYPR